MVLNAEISGGCQCGAVRYRLSGFGRASVCHCRMCQKAFGGFFGPLVTAHDFEITRGAPGRFDSSTRNWRRFCRDCGTPLTYEFDGGVEVAIGSLDKPDLAPPTVQTNTHGRLDFFEKLSTLPELTPEEIKQHQEWNAGVVSNQHPDDE